MDSLDLLAREDEFKKLNKQLEKKTESLIKEIETVMQKPDFFAEFSPNLTLSPQRNIKKHCCDTPKSSTSEHSTPIKQKSFKPKSIRKTPKLCTELETQPVCELTSKNCNENDKKCAESDNNCQENINKCTNAKNCSSDVCNCDIIARRNRIAEDLEFLYAFVSVNVQDKVLPQSFLKEQRVSVESVCKYLSSKVKLLQEQIERLQETVNKKTTQCEVHLTHQAELESERMALLNKNNNLKSAATDMKAKCQAIQKRFDEKDRLYVELRSEADKLGSEVKRLRCKNANVEAKCASQEESIDNLKYQVEISKKAEKEIKDTTRTLSASHNNAISRQESRIKFLTTRIEKQAALIDNLKRQNALLSVEGAVKNLEKDYCDFLMQDL